MQLDWLKMINLVSRVLVCRSLALCRYARFHPNRGQLIVAERPFCADRSSISHDIRIASFVTLGGGQTTSTNRSCWRDLARAISVCRLRGPLSRLALRRQSHGHRLTQLGRAGMLANESVSRALQLFMAEIDPSRARFRIRARARVCSSHGPNSSPSTETGWPCKSSSWRQMRATSCCPLSESINLSARERPAGGAVGKHGRFKKAPEQI